MRGSGEWGVGGWGGQGPRKAAHCRVLALWCPAGMPALCGHIFPPPREAGHGSLHPKSPHREEMGKKATGVSLHPEPQMEKLPQQQTRACRVAPWHPQALGREDVLSRHQGTGRKTAAP